jgi:hypothetical protein
MCHREESGLVSGFRGALGAALALALAAGAAAAEEPRTVLQTGDRVPGLGRIGVWGLGLVGMDARGRALVNRIDSQHDATVWADGERFVPLVDPAEGDVEMAGQALNLHPAGPVVGYGYRRGGSRAYDTFYSVVGGRVTQVARVGDRDAEGNTICELRNAVINGSGAVALAAAVTPAGYECGDLYADEPTVPYYDAVYLADGLRRVGGAGPLSPPGWTLSALTLHALSDAGEALVHGFGGESAPAPEEGVPAQVVLALGPEDTRLLYRLSDTDGPREIGVGDGAGWFQLVTVSAAGEVAFRRREAGTMGLYRTVAGQVRRLFAAGDPAPWGGAYAQADTFAWPSSFTDRGDLLLPQVERHLVLYPADGPVRVFPGRVLSGAINERGDVAILQRTTDESLEVVRHRNGNVRRLAATGDRLPSGDVLAEGGIEASCMAPNGAVAAVAQATSGATALVCGDSRGFRTVSRMGDPRPDGRRFYRFDACAFAAPDALVFIGRGLAPSGRPRDYVLQSAVYRALPRRLERVLGPGDVLADGSLITDLPRGWRSLLDADASGRVLTLAATSDGHALVVADPDGTLARLPVRLRTSSSQEHIVFEPDSSIDHEYLSGISARPRRAAAAGGRSALRAMASDDPYYDADALWPSGAGLAASGGAFILGWQPAFSPDGERSERSFLLYARDDAVQRIAAAGAGGFPAAPFDSPGVSMDMLRVNGDRVAFALRGQSTSVFTYALGDAAPTELARSGDPTPVGALTHPNPLGIGGDGRVYFIDQPQDQAGRQFVFVWQDGAIRVVAPADGLYAFPVNAVSHAGALLIGNYGILRVSGAAASGATCPYPPTLVPSPPPPTPTPWPDEPTHPPNLPFDPQRCTADGVCLHVRSAAGSPGSRVQVDVWLDSRGESVAGTENVLRFPPLAAIRECIPNPAINKPHTVFNITPDSTKAIVISLVDSGPIADGAVLYTCEIEIAADAAPGLYRLGCADQGAAEPAGTELPTTCADGVLTVVDEATGSAPQVAGHSGSGCAVRPGATPAASVVPLTALLLAVCRAVLRRRRA